MNFSPKGNFLYGTNALEVSVKTGSYGIGKLIVCEVYFRLDGRGGSWRVDVLKPFVSIWEAIDNGESFADAMSAEEYAQRYYDEMRKQKTLLPKVKR